MLLGYDSGLDLLEIAGINLVTPSDQSRNAEAHQQNSSSSGTVVISVIFLEQGSKTLVLLLVCGIHEHQPYDVVRVF